MRLDGYVARGLNVVLILTRRAVRSARSAPRDTANRPRALPESRSWTSWLVLARLWFWAAVVRPLKHVVPIMALARVVHARPVPRRRESGLADRLDVLFRSTGRFPSRPPSNCLERSLGAYRLLCLAGAQPELVIGMKRGPGDRIEGHTWVVVDGRPLGETAGAVAGFARVLAFDARGRQTTGPARLPRGTRVA
jgi:hypothetical protein